MPVTTTSYGHPHLSFFYLSYRIFSFFSGHPSSSLLFPSLFIDSTSHPYLYTYQPLHSPIFLFLLSFLSVCSHYFISYFPLPRQPYLSLPMTIIKHFSITPSVSMYSPFFFSYLPILPTILHAFHYFLTHLFIAIFIFPIYNHHQTLIHHSICISIIYSFRIFPFFRPSFILPIIFLLIHSYTCPYLPVITYNHHQTHIKHSIPISLVSLLFSYLLILPPPFLSVTPPLVKLCLYFFLFPSFVPFSYLVFNPILPFLSLPGQFLPSSLIIIFFTYSFNSFPPSFLSVFFFISFSPSILSFLPFSVLYFSYSFNSLLTFFFCSLFQFLL